MRQNDQDRLTIIEWLTPMDYANQQTDLIARRQEGTRQWLLDTNEFKCWCDQRGQTLYCPGIPGAGKTMMTSIVVEHLSQNFQNNASTGIAYLYCIYQRQEEQNPVELLTCLLKQLVQEKPTMPDSMKDLYKCHKDKRTRPSFDEISKVLHSVIASPSYSRVFILIDALDECQVSDGGRRRFLSEVFNLQAKTGVNLFATSRFIPDIKEELKNIIQEF
jgi:predicted ATPase